MKPTERQGHASLGAPYILFGPAQPGGDQAATFDARHTPQVMRQTNGWSGHVRAPISVECLAASISCINSGDPIPASTRFCTAPRKRLTGEEGYVPAGVDHLGHEGHDILGLFAVGRRIDRNQDVLELREIIGV